MHPFPNEWLLSDNYAYERLSRPQPNQPVFFVAYAKAPRVRTNDRCKYFKRRKDLLVAERLGGLELYQSGEDLAVYGFAPSMVDVVWLAGRAPVVLTHTVPGDAIAVRMLVDELPSVDDDSWAWNLIDQTWNDRHARWPELVRIGELVAA